MSSPKFKLRLKLNPLRTHFNAITWDLYLQQLTGHVADLSLKGSPYWMAPEVYYILILQFFVMSHGIPY